MNPTFIYEHTFIDEHVVVAEGVEEADVREDVLCQTFGRTRETFRKQLGGLRAVMPCDGQVTSQATCDGNVTSQTSCDGSRHVTQIMRWITPHTKCDGHHRWHVMEHISSHTTCDGQVTSHPV